MEDVQGAHLASGELEDFAISAGSDELEAMPFYPLPPKTKISVESISAGLRAFVLSSSIVILFRSARS